MTALRLGILESATSTAMTSPLTLQELRLRHSSRPPPDHLCSPTPTRCKILLCEILLEEPPMTTPINTFEEILEALERDPALKEALRRHILTDELLQMPVRLERIETDVSTLKENLTTLTNTVNRIGGDVSMLKGSDYESHVARLANRFLRRQLGVAATIFSSQRNRAALATLLDDAETQGNIDAAC